VSGRVVAPVTMLKAKAKDLALRLREQPAA
jgi:hypothetical protein